MWKDKPSCDIKIINKAKKAEGLPERVEKRRGSAVFSHEQFGINIFPIYLDCNCQTRASIRFCALTHESFFHAGLWCNEDENQLNEAQNIEHWDRQSGVNYVLWGAFSTFRFQFVGSFYPRLTVVMFYTLLPFSGFCDQCSCSLAINYVNVSVTVCDQSCAEQHYYFCSSLLIPHHLFVCLNLAPCLL